MNHKYLKHLEIQNFQSRLNIIVPRSIDLYLSWSIEARDSILWKGIRRIRASRYYTLLASHKSSNRYINRCPPFEIVKWSERFSLENGFIIAKTNFLQKFLRPLGGSHSSIASGAQVSFKLIESYSLAFLVVRISVWQFWKILIYTIICLFNHQRVFEINDNSWKKLTICRL